MSQDITGTLKSRVACREKKSMTVWMSSSLPLHPQNSPPMTALLPTSLPAHYPCQTRPGPTWHGLVDLIELDIPACLGIVCWHENLPAIPLKTVDKRGICNTCRHIWELEFLRAGGGLWQKEGSPVPHCAPAWCQVQSGTCPGLLLHLILWCGKCSHLTNCECVLENFSGVHFRPLTGKLHLAGKSTWWNMKAEMMHLKVSTGAWALSSLFQLHIWNWHIIRFIFCVPLWGFATEKENNPLSCDCLSQFKPDKIKT